ncbi:hypothetical protein [Aeromicrobium chenweiae]|uniref:Uncharacterized protein n=1 Tax=Aeromicrobium chenweiae TaxID=2079793 RepID=A0A2S0WM66_9ACTN|nr:hypothetical protein [Aeromicrobium chenweiae]AWB92354.1 hypothetical protein C3E78_09150 [Aeromicrobium chenweiae]TGN31359.1 hypothetical protein E4L97_13420 [Aeromicrobium chenweiae]
MTATFRLGFKNVLGSNWTRTRHRWPGRAVMLEREMHGPDGMQASAYFLVEVNRRAERRSLARILPGWEVARSRRGHNDAYSDPSVHRLLDSHEHPLGTFTRQQRYVLIARYEHLASGVEWVAATTHLSSSVHTTPEKAEASRGLQAARLAELCAEHGVDVVAADINNVAVRPDTPRGILEAAGYTDWRDATQVRDADVDVHHRIGEPLTRTGRHLDAIYLGGRVTAVDGRVQMTEPDSSDHLGLVCTVAISPGDREP